MSLRNSHPDRPGRYLTDGARLFQVIASVGKTPHGRLLEVEDCGSLDVLLMTRDELRRLTPVQVHRRAPIVTGSEGRRRAVAGARIPFRSRLPA